MQSKFHKFRILSQRPGQAPDLAESSILINLEHLVSVRPIRINLSEDVVSGYWIRLSNGKKYRATEIPKSLESLLEKNDRTPKSISSGLPEEVVMVH